MLRGKYEDNTPPESEEICQFWNNIWEQEVSHNHNVEWVHSMRSELHHLESLEQDHVRNTTEDVIAQISKLPNWKVARPDGIQSYWLRWFRPMYKRTIRLLPKERDHSRVGGRGRNNSVNERSIKEQCGGQLPTLVFVSTSYRKY